MSWENYDPQYYDDLRSGHMTRRRLQLIEKVLKSSHGKILDFGCGTGHDISFLAKKNPDREFYGLDTDERFIDFAMKNYSANNLHFINDSIFNLKLSFGFIYSIDVLHHVDDENAVIKQIYSILDPDGEWVLIEPNILNPKVFLNQLIKKDERFFYKRKTENLLNKAGFKLIKKGLFLLIPYQLKQPNTFLISIESKLERYLGGSVYYVFKKNRGFLKTVD